MVPPPVCVGFGFGLEAPPWPAFSEAGSWRRGLSAASVSAAGGAAPVLMGRAASWSWTKWTVWREGRRQVRPADLRGTRAAVFFLLSLAGDAQYIQVQLIL